MGWDSLRYYDAQCAEINSVRCDYDNIPKVFGHLKIVHINARDLRTCGKLFELQMLADTFNIDVICVSETFFTEFDCRAYPLIGFIQLSVVRDIRSGGGVSVYVRDSIEVVDARTAASEDQNVQLVTCRLKRRAVLCDVVAFYSNHREQHAALVSLLDQHIPLTSQVPCVLCGDANINTLVEDALSNEYLSFMATKGFVATIRDITRSESQTCLDHMFVTTGRPIVEVNAAVITTNIFSDHYPVMTALCLLDTLAWLPVGLEQAPVPRRIFSSTNYYKFARLVSAIDFKPVYSCTNVDKALGLFQDLVFSIYDTAFPVKSFIPPKPRAASDAFNKELRICRRRLDRVRRKYFRNKTNIAIKGEYYCQLKSYKKMVRNAQARKYSGLFNGRTSRDHWITVNRFLGRNMTLQSPRRIFLDGTLYEGDKMISEAFCEFFSTIGHSTTKHLISTKTPPSSLMQMGPLYREFSIGKIYPANILREGRSLKGDLNGSLESVPSRVWKQFLHSLAEPLAFIFNLSITTAIFPAQLKVATVLPLYKGRGAKDDPSNYRPITLCPFLSKVFEKCIAAQITAHLREIDYFDSSQYGFRPGRSTELALCDMYDYITKSCVGGNAVLGAFLDTSKAFDCVSHELFINLLDTIGFATGCCKWFQSYLSERLIKVRVDKAVSTNRIVNIGVPQGSTLGPLIFIIYINVILRHIRLNYENLHVVCYADDVTILSKVDKDAAAHNVSAFEYQLDSIGDLYKALLLSLNASKTIVTVFSSTQSKLQIPSQIYLRGEKLDIVENVKCLGLVLYRRLNWLANFISTKKRCYYIIAVLSRMRSLGIPLQGLLLLYKTLFLPILTYAIIVWGGTFPTHLHLLEVVQNDAVRAVLGLTRATSVAARYVTHDLLPLKQLYVYRTAVVVYNELIKSSLAVQRHKLRAPPQYELRGYHPSEVKCHKADTLYDSMSPRYQHSKIWNSLPVEVRCSGSLTAFKKALLSHLRSTVP